MKHALYLTVVRKTICLTKMMKYYRRHQECGCSTGFLTSFIARLFLKEYLRKSYQFGDSSQKNTEFLEIEDLKL